MSEDVGSEAEKPASDAPAAPPGWYQDSAGTRRWWDGRAWAPDAEASGTDTPEPPRKKRQWPLNLFIFLVVVVGGFFLLKGWSGDAPPSADKPAAEAKNIEKQPAPQPAKTPEQLDDEFYSGQGFQVVESGAHYFRWATDEEKAGGSCGYSKCTWGVIHTVKGCTSGFYVKADLLSGGTKFDWTNVMTPSAAPNETNTFTLEDFQGAADSFKISEINCMDY